MDGHINCWLLLTITLPQSQNNPGIIKGNAPTSTTLETMVIGQVAEMSSIR